MRRLLGVFFAAVLLTAGCSADDVDEPPTAEDVASQLAMGLAARDVGSLSFVSAVSTTDDPASTAAETTDTSTDATVTLQWSWPIGADGWSYRSTATLRRTGGRWQPTWSRTVVEPDLADGDTLRLSSVTGARGDVLGADGAVLVTDRPVQKVGIDKTLVAGGAAPARRLARLVGVEVKPYVAAVQAAGPQAFVSAITYRQDEIPDAVTAGLADIDGARSIGAQLPLSPTRDFAAPILGRVGDVTAEMIQKDPDTYRAGDVAGLSGLQARYDDVLRGTPAALVEAISDEGATRELFRSDPVPGADLTLTLDQGLQKKAEALLSGVGPASALVALRPSTGDLVVAANGPGNGGQNLATFGQYAPGSTFKIVSALALLRAGETPTTTVPCTSSITVDGKQFTNYDDYPADGTGDIALRTALANSCNTAFISQADQIGDGDLLAAANALGLGIDHEVGFPAYFGQVEPPASETQGAADLIGQGTVLASPMTMAAVIASVQQGSTVVPRLVVDPAPSDAAAAPAAPLTAPEARSLKEMLRGVVTDGSGALLADLPGEPVIAKTGTAEFGTADDASASGGELPTHAWMVAAQGDLAVAVFVDVGESGSGTAGPILKAFLQAARG